MMFPLVRELAADGVPVVVSCRVLKLCRAQYYRWLDTPIGDRELAQAYVANAVCDAHVDDPEFGYRFLADEARAAGYPVSDRTVWARCSENGWWASFTKPRNRKAEQAKRAVPAHDDLVRWAFGAEGLDELWVSDITEHPTGEGKLYVCVVKDMWSQRVIGWAISDRMKAGLVVAAINTAAARRGRPVDGCTFHSDRGSQAGFKWSSQHPVMEVLCGSSSASSGSSRSATRCDSRLGRRLRWRSSPPCAA